ncbi:MAG: PIG-L family deacetylase [Nitrospirae bacterium]|nr:PIG-L family deacetylase [Nitrospirota bacterium]
MKFNRASAVYFVPDGLFIDEAIKRTTHMGIGAHQDDLEVMAAEPIIKCFQKNDQWFTGVVATDGRGSPRDGLYKDHTDEEMRLVRIKEQKKAATIGEYSAQILLDYPSDVVKSAASSQLTEDIIKLLHAAHPQFLYTHNLADKHDTHVAVALRVIGAIRALPRDMRPQKLFGCEVWRDLDWMLDGDKVPLDVSAYENLQAALLSVFDSQICGGKRYDLAAMGRRRAHATFLSSHQTDAATGLTFAMDLTPLISDPTQNVIEFVQEYIHRFADEVSERIGRFC